MFRKFILEANRGDYLAGHIELMMLLMILGGIGFGMSWQTRICFGSVDILFRMEGWLRFDLAGSCINVSATSTCLLFYVAKGAAQDPDCLLELIVRIRQGIHGLNKSFAALQRIVVTVRP